MCDQLIFPLVIMCKSSRPALTRLPDPSRPSMCLPCVTRVKGKGSKWGWDWKGKGKAKGR